MNRKIKYRTLGDVHLFHRRNKTASIIFQILMLFHEFKEKMDLDIIFIAGDLFDRLVDFNHEDVAEFTIFARRLIAYCSKHNIKLRILEGTPGHDWKQSRNFNALVHEFKGNIDFKYIDTVAVEKMEDLGISVLYIPDEWKGSTEKAYQDALTAMAEQNLAQVDLAIMHGCFNYQLPEKAHKAPRHNEEDYLRIVKYYISINHHHTHSVYQRIMAGGSVDRLAHGEEEAKGCMEFEIFPDGTMNHYFIENKHTTIYKTINLRSNDIDECLNTIVKRTQGFPVGSHVRLRAARNNPAIVGFDEIKNRFFDFKMSKITLEEEKEAENYDLVDDITTDTDGYIPISITPDNVSMLLMEEVVSKHQMDNYDRGMFVSLIEECR